MARLSLVLHWLLAIYLWLISWVSLGAWNAQPGPHMLSAVRAGGHLGAADWGFFAFVTLPAMLFTVAYVRRSLGFFVSALLFDLIWLGMQVQSWWLAYITGNPRPWQVEYARGATTKLLPSFGSHVAPDAMHTMISVLLLAAMITALLSVAAFRRARAA